MPATASVRLCQSGTHTRCCAVARKKGSTDAIIAACDEVSATSQSAEPVEARLGEQVAKVLSDFCATIRKEAVSGHIAVLDACDYVRDDALTEIGVRLEDATREAPVGREHDEQPEVLRHERDECKRRGDAGRVLKHAGGEMRIQARSTANERAQAQRQRHAARRRYTPPAEGGGDPAACALAISSSSLSMHMDS